MIQETEEIFLLRHRFGRTKELDKELKKAETNEDIKKILGI